MFEDMEVLTQYVEMLGLHKKTNFTIQDMNELKESLKDNGEYGLADWVDQLGSPEEFQEFVNENMEF